jgi:hypothetical protein
MDNSVASVSREFRVACPGRGPKMPDPPVLRILDSKLAVQGRYNQRLFLHVLSGSLQGIAVRPLPCNYYGIADLVTMAARLRLARAPGPNPPRPLDHGSLGNKRHL